MKNCCRWQQQVSASSEVDFGLYDYRDGLGVQFFPFRELAHSTAAELDQPVAVLAPPFGNGMEGASGFCQITERARARRAVRQPDAAPHGGQSPGAEQVPVYVTQVVPAGGSAAALPAHQQFLVRLASGDRLKRGGEIAAGQCACRHCHGGMNSFDLIPRYAARTASSSGTYSVE